MLNVDFKENKLIINEKEIVFERHIKSIKLDKDKVYILLEIP